MNRVYLDHNATTPQAPEVTEAMRPYWEERFANPSSTHLDGQRVRHDLEAARSRVASFLSASAAEIAFTAGGTESINLAILGVARARPGRHLVTSTIEHPAGRSACDRLEAEGYEVGRVGPDRHGRIDPEEVAAAIRADTVLVSIMHANGETGVLQEVAPIGRACRRRGVPFHTDAVQSAGKVPLRVDALEADLVSIAAHKFYGPKGIGALYCRRGVSVQPLLVGGGQEGGRRSGTEPVALAVGMGRACELAADYPARYRTEVRPLRDRLEAAVLRRFPGAAVNGGGAPRLPNTASIRFPGISGEELVIGLDLAGFAASVGTACSSGAHRPSPVLLAMGLPERAAAATVRFSLGLDNRREEIDRLLDRIAALLPPVERAAG